LLVVSHWLLDVIVHQPDLPLYPGASTLMGFNLWSSLHAIPSVVAIAWVGQLQWLLIIWCYWVVASYVSAHNLFLISVNRQDEKCW
jgi:hypothetical protein